MAERHDREDGGMVPGESPGQGPPQVGNLHETPPSSPRRQLHEVCLLCGMRLPIPPAGPLPILHDCQPKPPRKWRHECPTCGAQPGTPCVQMPSGHEMTYAHVDRMNRALALEEVAA